MADTSSPSGGGDLLSYPPTRVTIEEWQTASNEAIRCYLLWPDEFQMLSACFTFPHGILAAARLYHSVSFGIYSVVNSPIERKAKHSFSIPHGLGSLTDCDCEMGI
jgi:hypothetical protein